MSCYRWTTVCPCSSQPEYIPGPKVRESEELSIQFYKILDRTREEDLLELRQYEGREDLNVYELSYVKIWPRLAEQFIFHYNVLWANTKRT